LPEVEEERLPIVQEKSAPALVLDAVAGSKEALQTTQVQHVNSSSENGKGDEQNQSKQELNSNEGNLAKSRPEEFRPSKVRPPRPRKKLVKYPVIGRNNVAVPTHLYKVSYQHQY
jgi:hypothetical protein